MRWPIFAFELGQWGALEVREEVIGGKPDGCRIAYVSDIHLRRERSAYLVEQVLEAVKRAGANLILLGGDLVDQESQIPELVELVKQLVLCAPVFVVPGNHDVAVGEPGIRDAVETAGAVWIHRRCEIFGWHGRRIAVSGTDPVPEADADVRVLCAHNPRVWREARREGFDLVLAGHLHGCQAVAFEAGGKLYPGAWFYPYNFIRQRDGDSLLLVSRGCSDLIPIRWRCPREILLCVL